MTAGFVRRMGCYGRYALAISTCVFAFSGASSDGDAPDSSVPSIQSVFESTAVKLNATPDSQSIPVEWTYTNHFDYPLLVERFDQSCGCLSGQIAPSGHETVLPGKTGKIRATFNPGNHRGKLSKSLHVRFVGHEKPVELVAEVIIASHVELSQRELIWKAGEIKDAKIIEITSGTGKPFTITSLPGVPENQFTLVTETQTPGTRYRLHITPSTSAVGQHCLQIRTDSPDPRDSIHALFLSIEATPPTPSGS